MSESTKRHEENFNLIKEIRASRDVAIRNQGASIKTLEIQIGKISKVLQERGFGSLPSSTEENLRDQVKSISTTIEADSYPIRRIGSKHYAVYTGQNHKIVKYPKGIAENVLVGIGKFVFPVDFIIQYLPEDIKVPLILGRPFLSIARAKIIVYKRKITLRVGEERIIFTSVKPASKLIKRVYMISLREKMELDLESRLMGETLVINRSLDPMNEDYIELNDLNEPFKLRRNQGDDLMPTIKEGKVIEEFKTRDDEVDTGIDYYPSYCDYDKKIHIDYKMVYKGNNVIGALMNVPIFVRTFYVVTDFVVLENMDAYRDDGMSDVIFGEPFLREVGIKTRQFEGMITIYNGDDEVTYQMVRSHPRFKHHTNEQCNKISPLLKVSDEDKKNEILHPYQKLKGFCKGVLNLGPGYIRDANTEE
ncbi:putative reverse transcriptase domain-containing protein [Tanacetum coccineum]